MLQAIITDWHGVIDKTTFETFVALIAKETNQQLGKCKEKIKEIAVAWTLGEIEPDVFWKKAQSLFGLDDQQVQKIKTYVLGIDFDNKVMDFLTSAKNAYTLALLSDCPKDKAEVIRQSKVAGLFSVMKFSCDMPRAKEDPKAFLNLLDTLRLPPDACLYIDDKQKHVATASSLGFQTCLFEKADDIVSALSLASIV